MTNVKKNIYEEVFDQVPVGLIYTDENGKIVNANCKMIEILECSSCEIIGKLLGGFIHTDDTLLDKKYRQQLLSGKIDHYSAELRFKSSLGKIIYCKFVCRVISNNKGEMNFMLGIVEDLTEIKKIEEEKEIIIRKMFQSSKLVALGKLAAGVGHEINNPLAIINGHIELLEERILKDKYSKEELIKVLYQQKKSVNRISSIVRGLRTYACESNLKVVEIDIHKVIDRVLDIMKVPFEKDEIYITKEYCQPTCLILGNFNKFQQVITNILSNAHDAVINHDKKLIRIKTLIEGETIRIKIIDNGIGMVQSVLDNAFDTFFTTKDIGQGSGLGLGVARNIIEASSGNIEINSLPQNGTTVNVQIPIYKSKMDGSIADISNKFNGRVLVVEDEKDIRTFIELILLRFGFHVDVADNGQDGFDLACKNEYKYIFTDLKMPKMSGEKMIKKIRKSLPFDGKIFVLTGIVENIGMDNLSDECLLKPFDYKTLYNLIIKYENNK